MNTSTTNSTTAATSERWCGWQRLPGRPWRVVVRAGTEAECHRLLLDSPCPGKTRDLTVLEAGRDPNVRN